MKIHFRLFSIFLVIILSLSFLSVNSFATEEENLIDSNMRNWEFQEVIGDWNTPVITYDSNLNRNIISFGAESVSRGDICSFYDLSSSRLVSGDSYSFNVSIFVNQWTGPSEYFRYNGFLIGFATLDSTGTFTYVDNCFIELSADNYLNFLSGDYCNLNFDFVVPNYTGTPIFAISIVRQTDVSHSGLTYSFEDISLTRNVSPEFDGILGWLQELWDSITDGFSNLGLSITHLGDRLQIKLGEVITNLSGELQRVRETITTKLGEISINLSNAFSAVGDRIQIKLGEVITGLTGELRHLGNRIINHLLYFDDEVPENPFEGVDSPLDHIQGFFDDLIDYLSNIGDDIETVIDSITGPVTLLDHFTKRFEWLFGIVTFTLMLIVVSRFIGL